MKGIFKKFEKTKEDITVIIKVPLGSSLHDLVDMDEQEVEFGLVGQTQVDMTDPLLSLISKQILAREEAAYKRGMDFAVQQLKEGEQNGINS